MTTTLTKAERIQRKAESLAFLRKHLNPGDAVYTLIAHVSRSGMSRDVRLFMPYMAQNLRLATEERGAQVPRIMPITFYVAHATDSTLADRGEWVIPMNGAGYDAGFELVYRLGRAIWPNGTPQPHGTRNGEPDSEGGYALKHEWL